MVVRRSAAVLLVIAGTALLAGCQSSGEAHYGAAYLGPPAYYNAYYDGFYGPFDGGYWGPDGNVFYYYDGDRYRRDDGHHFRHQPHAGFHHLHWHHGRDDRDHHDRGGDHRR